MGVPGHCRRPRRPGTVAIMDFQHTGRTVVVGVDGSESATEAVRWAAPEAVRRGVPLRVVTAFAWPPERGPGHPGLGEPYWQVLLERSRGLLAAAATSARETAPGAEVAEQLVLGSPIGVLSVESRRAQLVVIGNRGRGGVTGLLAGSVAVGLAGHVSCPVVVVRGAGLADAGHADLPVVVGVDGSPASEAALAFAFDAASVRAVPLLAVHTWWDLVLDPLAASLTDWDLIEADEQVVLAECLAGWGAKYPDVRVHRLVQRERPAHTLVAQSARAQLVVVGSRGRGALAGLVLGSVSHALLHRSLCPVAVVGRDPEPAS